MPSMFLEIIIISVVLLLLAGEVVAILNIYRLSNPISSIFGGGKSKENGLTIEEQAFLLRDLKLQKKLADREEQKIANGEIRGNISECKSRRNLLQTLINKIEATPLYNHWKVMK